MKPTPRLARVASVLASVVAAFLCVGCGDKTPSTAAKQSPTPYLHLKVTNDGDPTKPITTPTSSPVPTPMLAPLPPIPKGSSSEFTNPDPSAPTVTTVDVTMQVMGDPMPNTLHFTGDHNEKIKSLEITLTERQEDDTYKGTYTIIVYDDLGQEVSVSHPFAQR